MKKNQLIDLFQTIRKTLVSFIAIMMFVALSVAIFLGLWWSAEGVLVSADGMYADGNIADLQLEGTAGGTSEIEKELLLVDGIDTVEGVYSFGDQMELNGMFYETKLVSLPQKINLPLKVTGNLPTEKGEIALTDAWARRYSVEIGSTVTFRNKAFVPSLPNTTLLTTDSFTVTALIETAPYLSSIPGTYGISMQHDVPVISVAYIAPSSVNMPLFQGCNLIYLKSDRLDPLGHFSDEYKAQAERLREDVQMPAEKYGFTVSTLEENTSVTMLEMFRSVLLKLRFSMAGLFVIVGLLVCYFAVSRIVYEDKVRIGTKRALGFLKSEITSFYLMYAAIASLIGSVLGLLMAYYLVQPIILHAVTDSFCLNLRYVFDWKNALIIAALESVIQLLTVYVACSRVFRKQPIELLNGTEALVSKNRFYEKLRLWQKLPLFNKTVVNNFFNDPRRVFSTIVSIAGFTALMICAMTLKFNISDSFTLHYDRVFHYNAVVYIDENADIDEFEKLLSEKNFEYLSAHSQTVIMDAPDGQKLVSRLLVCDPETIEARIQTRNLSGKSLDYSEGVLVTCAYQNEYKVPDHTEMHFSTLDGKQLETDSVGFYEYYMLGNQMMISRAEYEKLFGTTPRDQTILLKLDNGNLLNLNECLSEIPGFLSLHDEFSDNRFLFDGLSTLYFSVVLIYLALAVAMGFLVLLNLLSMFVREKKREVLTLVINGYSRNDAKKYILSDTVLMTVIGIPIGMLLGTLMSNLSIMAYESEIVFLKAGFSGRACLIGAVISVVLTLVISLIALREIDTFKLTEINEK